MSAQGTTPDDAVRGNGRNGHAPQTPTDLGSGSWLAAARRSWPEFSNDFLQDRAAALTYYAVQAIFPLLFVTLFLSSSSLPRNLIKVDWFREVATYNPMSYLIEGVRSLIITGWDGRALALGFGFAALLVAITLGLANAAMKSRLVRT